MTEKNCRLTLKLKSVNELTLMIVEICECA